MLIGIISIPWDANETMTGQRAVIEVCLKDKENIEAMYEAGKEYGRYK